MEAGTGALYLRGVEKRPVEGEAEDYAFRIPAIARLGRLEFRRSVTFFVGENGSGKTTLMNMLAGIYFPDEGKILVNGEPTTIASPKDAFACGIGMIHQHFKLVDVLTAAENIVLGLDQKGRLDRKKVAREVRAISGKYGFDIDPDQKIYNMSVSQKQTVEIGKVL